MRIHVSSTVTILVTLLFVSGTVGCHSNGGAWYSPKSYSWSNPFVKSSQAPPYAPEALANTKPSLDASPNVGIPPGGYTDGLNAYASRSGSQNTTSSGYAPDQGGYPSPIASQGATSPYGGYSVAEPSPYPPTYAGGQPLATNAAATQQYQYPAEMAPQMAQQGNPMPYGYSDYAAGAQYQATSAVSHPSATPNYDNNYGGANPAMNGGNYAPFGATPQNDPYAAANIQQSIPAAYTNDAVPVATPYQPYQPSPSGGYSY